MTKRLIDVDDDVLEAARVVLGTDTVNSALRASVQAAERRHRVDVAALQRFAEASRDLLDLLIPVTMPVRAEERSRELQRDLVTQGQHHGVSVPHLLLAAIADIEELTILHYDADFDLISDVTGQPTEWVVPRGSID